MVNFKDIYIHQRQEQRHVAGWQFTIVQWQIIRTISFLSHGIGLPPVFSLVKWVMTVSWDETIDLSPANFFSSLFLRRIEIAAIRTRRNLSSKTTIRNLISPNCSTIISNSTFQPSIDEKLPHFSPNSTLLFLGVRICSRKKKRKDFIFVPDFTYPFSRTSQESRVAKFWIFSLDKFVFFLFVLLFHPFQGS